MGAAKSEATTALPDAETLKTSTEQRALEATDAYETALSTEAAAKKTENDALDVSRRAAEAAEKSATALENATDIAALKAATEADVLEAINALQPPAEPDTRRRLLTMESLLREIELS